MQLKQFVSQECCGNCDVCCRFLDEETPLAPLDTLIVPQISKKYLTGLAPVGLSLVPYQDRCICANFDPAANSCKDYENRPLDCQLYPFVLMWDEKYKDVVLGIDHKCPYSKHVMPAKAGVHSFILDSRFRGNDNIDPKYILRFQDDIEILEKLDVKVEPQLNKLLIGDKALFERYANQNGKPVSTYSFVANYVWTGLLDYYWMVIDGNFCLFCKTKETIFMPLPPLGKRLSKKAVKKSFKFMNENNKNKNCSRIEDITQSNLEFFEDLGYKVIKNGCEYIYRQKDLSGLAGGRYKAKRALCNYFEKNCKFNIREFEPRDKEGCLDLFKRWADERIKKGTQTDGAYYKALMEDSEHAHKKAMERFRGLGLVGRVVVIDGRIAAYTFGYELNEEAFVILFEVADLRLKGLAQFIFREFCSQQARFKYINAMDDSGLENLRRAKMSYHPVRMERTFCAYE